MVYWGWVSLFASRGVYEAGSGRGSFECSSSRAPKLIVGPVDCDLGT